MLLIAEIGQNHNGDMNLAKKMISVAKECGADVAKFQLYDVDSIFKSDFEWYREAKEAEMSFDDTRMLKNECDRIGIEFMASVFDRERLGWIMDLDARRIKIASRSIYNSELINACAKTGKDLIVSLGMYKEDGFPYIKTAGKIDFLHCVAKYPTRLEEVNFRSVDFNKYSGFSDHTLGIEASIVAMARGARIIEKHFTLDKDMHGPDHKCSMDPKELKELVKYSSTISRALGEKG